MGRRVVERVARIPEGRILNGIFVVILGATVAVLAADLRDLMSRDDLVVSGFPAAAEPMPMQRPTENDQIRPYVPASYPKAPDGGVGPGYSPDPNQAARMTFSLNSNGEVRAEGTIEPGTADELRRALDKWGAKATTLVLQSPGGHVPDAIEMARLLRSRGMKTRVPDDAYCASSCPLVFAGGIDRIASAKAWIGVHQVYAVEAAGGTVHDGMRDAQLVTARTQQMLDEFGVDARLWILAMQTPKEKLYFFTGRELKAYKLATRISN